MRVLYPPARWRPVSYAGEADPMKPSVRGWILHVVQGNGSPWKWFNTRPVGSRAFSHLWFAKDGRVEQYQYLNRCSWAQADGNRSWWSCETEGWDTEPLTDAQVRALARWHRWCGARDTIALSPSGRGIGTHSMGGSAWGGHACPGRIRAAQRRAILTAAKEEGKETMEWSDHVQNDGEDVITAQQAVRGAYLCALEASKDTEYRLVPGVRQLVDASATGLRRMAEIKDALTEAAAALADVMEALGAMEERIAAIAGGGTDLAPVADLVADRLAERLRE